MPDIRYAAPEGELTAYLAKPAGAGPWPGVVVVHEIFGLTNDVRRQADRFAAAGYLALAPDLYSWGLTPRCLVATLRTLSSGSGRARDDIDAARRHLAQQDDCTGKVGIIGFCLGGGLALLVSPDGFDAAAPNYGFLPKDPVRQLEGACPVVASYGGKDRPLKGAASKLTSVLEQLGVDHDVKEYAEARHGFLFKHHGMTGLSEPLFVAYDAEAADDAWRRIFTFFDARLKEPTT
ncbi:MAG TPA: dienelactone hydrolase family protein [Mycobacteriales bacterium]|nr:dienelactone hydrolase family protein [Mycobacteriales bacterium]